MEPRTNRRSVLGLAAGAALASPALLRGVATPEPTPQPPATLRAPDIARSGPLDALLRRRRMVRAFTAEPVDDATVRWLVDTATRAPSAGNLQPWAFVVVRDRETRAALARAALGQSFVGEAPVVLVPCADPDRARGRYGERAERYAIIDTSFASLLLLLAVAEVGLGACFVGAFDDAEVTRLLHLPPSVRPLAVIPVGHPAEKPRAMPRRPARDVVHVESW